jgi:hypothetical protein
MLTHEQLTILAAAIAAETDPDFVEYRTQGATGAMADFYSAAHPTFIVWRTSVTQDEIMQNGFDWTRVDNLANGPARIWEWMFNNQVRAINPSKLNVRDGIEAVWKGTAADLAVRAAVYVHCKRNATKGEALFATGTGTTASPGALTFEGYISNGDIVAAINL